VSDDGRGLRFGTVAEDYDRYRPAPPPEAAGLFGDLTGHRVLEVGAGTGQLTRFLRGLGAEVSIIEPDDAMRAVLVRRSPEVTVLDGRAESVPAADASFDVVASSSAWHWFEQPAATIELARVLRDEGRIFVLWNGFSRDDPWMRELTRLREREGDSGRRPRGWHAELAVENLFREVRDVTIDWTYTLAIDDVVALFRTYSGAIIRSEDDRRAMDVAVRARLTARFGDGPAELPMTLRGTTARRRDR
jgi:SAM-dependent methyltransferase